jgi:hypothetical protein
MADTEEVVLEKETQIRFGGVNYIKRSVVNFLRYVFKKAPFIPEELRWTKDSKNIIIVGFYPEKPSGIPEIVVKVSRSRSDLQYIGGVGKRYEDGNIEYAGRKKYSVSCRIRSYSVDQTEIIQDLVFFVFVNKRIQDAFSAHHKAFFDPNSISFTGITETILTGSDRPLFEGEVTFDLVLEWFDKELEVYLDELADIIVGLEKIDP